MSVEEYKAAVGQAMGVDPALFEQPGMSVVRGETRRDTRIVSHYRIGERSMLWADPELADEIGDWPAETATLTFEAFGEWATSRSGERLGAGIDHALDADVEMPSRSTDAVTLDGTSPEAIALYEAMAEGCSEDDIDEAEFESDDLDPFLVGWIDDGRLLALAGARPWDERPGMFDIGVLVHPDARRRGLGRAVVAGVVDELRAAGKAPLYRCNADNVGSAQLARSLGFTVAVELEAYKFA